MIKVTKNSLQIEIFKQIAGLSGRNPEEVAKEWCNCPHSGGDRKKCDCSQAAKFCKWFEKKAEEKYWIMYRIEGTDTYETQIANYHEVVRLDQCKGYYVDIAVVKK